MAQRVKLNDMEQRIAKAVAKARYLSNRTRGVEDKKVGPQSNAETDLNGIGAEIAFCSLFNVYPDLSIASGQPPAEDCILRSGLTVDVKATTYNNGRLIAVPWKGDVGPVDCYALMVGRFPYYRFAGFMSAAELLSENRLGDLGHGATYVADQNELTREADSESD